MIILNEELMHLQAYYKVCMIRVDNQLKLFYYWHFNWRMARESMLYQELKIIKLYIKNTKVTSNLRIESLFTGLPNLASL
jgi:hypothetical protein